MEHLDIEMPLHMKILQRVFVRGVDEAFNKIAHTASHRRSCGEVRVDTAHRCVVQDVATQHDRCKIGSCGFEKK